MIAELLNELIFDQLITFILVILLGFGQLLLFLLGSNLPSSI